MYAYTVYVLGHMYMFLFVSVHHVFVHVCDSIFLRMYTYYIIYLHTYKHSLTDSQHVLLKTHTHAHIHTLTLTHTGMVEAFCARHCTRGLTAHYHTLSSPTTVPVPVTFSFSYCICTDTNRD